MSVGRFDTESGFRFLNTGWGDLLQLEGLWPKYIEIEDTGTAGDLNTVRHAMGKVPQGVCVVRVVGGSAPSSTGWYQLDTDDDWDDTELNLRFIEDNLRVLLEVF